MSAIAGIAGDSPDRVDRVKRMCAAQMHRGPDRSAQRFSDSYSFGHNALFATPESVNEAQPIVNEATGCVIVADIRLDNRHELLKRFRTADPQTGDAELALLAYLNWGSDFSTHLLGDFALAIWDPADHVLILTRDHLGVRPIHYTTDTQHIVFASTVEGVFAGSGRRHPPNVSKLQHFLVDPLEVAEPNKSVFEGISALQAARTLTWSPKRGQTVKRYWTLEQPPTLRFADPQEYVEHFTEVLDQAVASRLRANGPVSSTLSGGLDSTAIVARAAGRFGSHLDLYGGIEDSPSIDSDTPFIAMTAAHLGVRLIEVSDTLVARTFSFDEAVALPSTLFDASAVLDKAILGRMQGRSRVLLKGLGPDTTLTVSPFDVIAEYGVRQTFDRWRELANVEDDRTSARAVLSFLLSPLPPAQFRAIRRSRSARRSFRSAVADAGIALSASNADPLWQAALDLRTRPEWTTDNRRLNRLRIPRVAIGLERYDRTGASFGVEVRNPFLDLRMVNLCLALPASQLQRHGLQKWVLRLALSGDVPEPVRLRPKAHNALAPFMSAVVATRQREIRTSAPEAGLHPVFGPLPVETQQGSKAYGWEHWQRTILRMWWERHGNTL